MSRFTQFSLVKRTDEAFRPSEKLLNEKFNSTDNTSTVYKMAMKMVGVETKYIDIRDTMKIVFRQAISTDNHPSIEEMNNRVIERLVNQLESSINRQKTFTKRTFLNGNIPSNMLARPSMSIERQDDDESRGKFTIELQR
jgi:hypothetical protein